eukprot:CCRYP_020208-RB/>CCRYP_020208-RB protein AED:0.23 eAED:0.23 QI:88/1/1/1/1/0.66/3/3109/340
MSSDHHEYRPPNHRLRRWHVKFGNPALGTYGGSIVTVHYRKIQRPAANDDDDFDELEEDETSTDSFSSCSSLDSFQCNDKSIHHQQQEKQQQQQQTSVAKETNKPSSRTAVMTNVPPHQVPDGVLNLVRSHRPFIEHVRIVIGASRSQERELRRARRLKRSQQQQEREEHQQPAERQQSLRKRSQTWACENANGAASADQTLELVGSFAQLSAEDKRVLGNLEPPNPKIVKDSRSFSLDITHFSKENSLQIEYENENALVEAGAEEEKDEGLDEMEDEHKNYHLLFVLDSDLSAKTFVSDLHHRPCKPLYRISDFKRFFNQFPELTSIEPVQNAMTRHNT